MITLAVVLLSLALLIGMAQWYGFHNVEGYYRRIQKGKHYSDWDWFPVILKKRKVGEQATVAFNITTDMIYDLPGTYNDLDWNKIVGEGSLRYNDLDVALHIKKPPHQVNSWRLAWSFDGQNSKVNLGIYYYQDTLRKEALLWSYPWFGQSKSEFTLQVNYNHMSTEFILSNRAGEVGRTTLDKDCTGLTYRLRPYFGGPTPAPGEMHIWYFMNKTKN